MSTETKTTHTPGPWAHSIQGKNHWIIAPHGRSVAFIGGKDMLFSTHPDTPHKANARLIAAAPELLTALEDVLRKMPFGANWDSEDNNPQWLKNARAAIAKATE